MTDRKSGIHKLFFDTMPIADVDEFVAALDGLLADAAEAKLGHRRCTAAYAEAREVGDAALARAATLETALREIRDLDVIYGGGIEPQARTLARAALRDAAPAEEQVGLDGPFEMETPAVSPDRERGS